MNATNKTEENTATKERFKIAGDFCKNAALAVGATQMGITSFCGSAVRHRIGNSHAGKVGQHPAVPRQFP